MEIPEYLGEFVKPNCLHRRELFNKIQLAHFMFMVAKITPLKATRANAKLIINAGIEYNIWASKWAPPSVENFELYIINKMKYEMKKQKTPEVDDGHDGHEDHDGHDNHDHDHHHDHEDNHDEQASDESKK